MSNDTGEYIEKHKQETKRLLGIDDEQLEQLVEYVLILKEKNQKKMENNQTRLVKAGGGRKSKLLEKTQIILTLIYLRHHVSFQLLGLMFNVSESTAHNIFHRWQKIIRTALPSSLIEQGEREDNLDDIIKYLANKILLIDSEEQAIERHSSYQEQKKFYSGKKKQHTFKNQIISINHATLLDKIVEIVDVVAGEPGPKSDIKICRENLYKLPKEQKFIGDKAYVGEEQITTPQKKPKNQELTEAQKEENKKISQIRIFVEHIIRIIKIFKITQDRFRLKKCQYETVFLTVCGLVRLRIGGLILNIIHSINIEEQIDVLLSHSLGLNFNFEENLTENIGFG